MKKLLVYLCLFLCVFAFSGCESEEEKAVRQAKDAARQANEVYQNQLNNYNELKNQIDEYNNLQEKLK